MDLVEEIRELIHEERIKTIKKKIDLLPQYVPEDKRVTGWLISYYEVMKILNEEGE